MSNVACRSSRYQGCSSFLQNIIITLFGKNNFEAGDETEFISTPTAQSELAESTGILSIKQVGQIYVSVKPLQIFDLMVKSQIQMIRNRVGIQRLILSLMNNCTNAFMLFHSKNHETCEWRFSYCRKIGKKESSDSKRYTFLLGPGQSCRTATDNFMALYAKMDRL